MSSLFENPGKLLKLANSMLLGGLLILVTGIVLAYWLDQCLPLPAVVGAHAMTILGPTLIKLGYVLRLLSLNRLRKDRPVFPLEYGALAAADPQKPVVS